MKSNIITEDSKLTNNYFKELFPDYVEIVDKFKSSIYTERLDFTKAESDEQIKQKVNHQIKSIVMKQLGRYYDETEIEKNLNITVKDTTPPANKLFWCWCGIKKGTPEYDKFIPGDTNIHFTIYFEISVETKPKDKPKPIIDTRKKVYFYDDTNKDKTILLMRNNFYEDHFNCLCSIEGYNIDVYNNIDVTQLTSSIILFDKFTGEVINKNLEFWYATNCKPM